MKKSCGRAGLESEWDYVKVVHAREPASCQPLRAQECARNTASAFAVVRARVLGHWNGWVATIVGDRIPGKRAEWNDAGPSVEGVVFFVVNGRALADLCGKFVDRDKQSKRRLQFLLVGLA